MQLGDPPRELERRAVLLLHHRPRAPSEAVEHRADRLRQAGGAEHDHRIPARRGSPAGLHSGAERGEQKRDSKRPHVANLVARGHYGQVPRCACRRLHERRPAALPASMSDLAIDIRNVVKRYDAHVAVSNLTLAVPRGTVYGLLGPNGAGKTTTIRMILDIIAPDEGTIRLFGEAHTTERVLDRVGYLPEERGLYKKMQVRRVLRFLAELKGVPGAEAERRIDEWMERLSLKTPEKNWGLAKVDELSRGMQQKVQFIGTLLHDPDLVILDEPFSGLDPVNAQALKDTVVELRQRGKTVVFSTHVMDNAEKMCDSVCIIARGVKVLDGTVAGVKRGV